MKNIITIFIITFIAQFTFAQTESSEDNTYTKSNEGSVIDETMPSWIGCESENGEEARTQCTYVKIREFLSENLKYPAEAKKRNISGTVYLTFVIDNYGIVKDARILRSVSKELDEEAIRIISLMPNWNPGVQRGKTVKVQYNIPVKFTLQDVK